MSEMGGILPILTVALYLLACFVFLYEYQKNRGRYYLWLSLTFFFLLIGRIGEMFMPDNVLLLAPLSMLGLLCAVYAIWLVWKSR
jgi:hypothetical protein